MKEFVLTPLGIRKKDIVPAEKQWRITVQMEYTEREANIVRAFMSRLLNCFCSEVKDNGQTD